MFRLVHWLISRLYLFWKVITAYTFEKLVDFCGFEHCWYIWHDVSIQSSSTFLKTLMQEYYLLSLTDNSRRHGQVTVLKIDLNSLLATVHDFLPQGYRRIGLWFMNSLSFFWFCITNNKEVASIKRAFSVFFDFQQMKNYLCGFPVPFH